MAPPFRPQFNREGLAAGFVAKRAMANLGGVASNAAAADLARVGIGLAEQQAYLMATQAWYRQNVQIETVLKRDVWALGRFGATLSMKQVATAAAQQAGMAAAEYAGLITKVQAEAIAKSKTQFRKAYENVGIAAGIASYDAYQAVKKTRPPGEARTPYRQGSRDSGGILERALLSRNMFIVGTNGIAWPNFDYLDSQARQWYRLNFGAGDRGKGGFSEAYQSRRTSNPSAAAIYDVAAFSDELGGLQEDIKLSFQAFNPSPSFLVPYGFWKGEDGNVSPQAARRGQDQFILGTQYGSFTSVAHKDGKNVVAVSLQRKRVSQQARRVSRGIAAWGFLNAGLQVIAEQAPAATSAIVGQAIFDTQIAPDFGPLARLNIDTTLLDSMSANVDAQLTAMTAQARELNAKILSGRYLS
jgi:hypothetical protein